MDSNTQAEIDAEHMNDVPTKRDDDEFDIIVHGLNRAESQTVMRLLRHHGSDRPGDLTIRPSRPLLTHRDGPFYDPASGERVDPTESELDRHRTSAEVER